MHMNNLIIKNKSFERKFVNLYDCVDGKSDIFLCPANCVRVKDNNLFQTTNRKTLNTPHNSVIYLNQAFDSFCGFVYLGVSFRIKRMEQNQYMG